MHHQAEILGLLGETPDDVARTLRARGIRGVRNTARSLNPVVQFIHTQLCDHAPHVGVTPYLSVRIEYPNGSKQEIPMTPAVFEFLEAFNRGKYPDLESHHE